MLYRKKYISTRNNLVCSENQLNIVTEPNLIAPNPREGRQREKLAHARTRDIRLTAQQCADAIDLPISEYAQVERHPGTLTLNELAALACAMGSAGQALIEGAFESLLA